MKRLLPPFLTLICLLAFYALAAQPDPASLPEAELLQLPAPDLQAVYKEDAARGHSPRFAVPVEASAGLQQGGTWTELEDGSRVWRIELRAKGALGLAVIYDQFRLPPGSHLRMYSPDGQQRRGPYTFQQNRPSGKFWTGFIRGEGAVLEYYEPAGQRGQGQLHFSRVDYAYRAEGFGRSPDPQTAASFGFGSSLDCHENANCPGGEEWEDQQRGICRIVMVLEEGTGYCSGSLINNTAEDETPYVLSAHHCQQGYTPLHDLWRFDFKYQSEGCNDPSSEPGFHSLMGCVQRATRQESDFLLLEITAPIAIDYNLYFNGWDRSGAAPAEGLLYHHPSGDIKKRSAYTQPAVVHPSAISWNNGDFVTPPNYHYEVRYSQGTFEVGSSGSPLFGENKKIRGQLHGGNSSCNGLTTAFYGRLSKSWEEGQDSSSRLSDWLDPLGLGIDSLGGRDKQLPEVVSIGGRVSNELGTPIANAQVYLSGALEDTVTTGADGLYNFFDVPLGGVVGLRVEKADFAAAGVSTADQVMIAKHVLGVEELGSPYRILSADINDSGGISVLDRIQIQKIILQLADEYNHGEEWRFLPAAWSLGEDPFEEHPFPDTFMIEDITGNITDLDFIGMKLGDMNLNSPTDN